MHARIEAILKGHEDQIYSVLNQAENDRLAAILDKLTRHAAALPR